MSVLLLIMLVPVYAVSVTAGFISTGFVVIYLIAAFYFARYYKNRLSADLVDFASKYNGIQKNLLLDMDVPYGICDDSGNIVWMNHLMRKLFAAWEHECNIFSIFGNITGSSFPTDDDEEVVTRVVYSDGNYRLTLKKMEFSSAFEGLDGDFAIAHQMYAVYMYDETEILTARRELENNRLVAGLIYMDNYEEALENLEDVRKSLLIALVDRKITQYFAKYNCILKKLEKDKYLFVMAYQYINDIREKKFSILEETKAVNIGNEMSITISIGVGLHGDSFAQNYEYARMAIDLALGRGGDQVVLKDHNKVEYFGGKSPSMEKSTRVKARVKAHALKELIESREKVLIMGHHLSDVDCIGAAVGIYRATCISGKKPYIVLDTIIESIRPLIDRFNESPDYPDDMFIKKDRAMELLDDSTVVCVVDVNRPGMTECPELLKRAKSVVILDHHRQTNEKIENAVLSYIEPYASSASEMVAEVLQYYADEIKIKAVEADAMYAGIVVDTDHFNSKTGIRTFEASAFLRRNGADITRVRKMFRENMQDYKVRAKSINGAEVFMDSFAISTCKGDTTESINVVAAQTANELLNIKGIQASFVLCELEDKIYVSARSIDEVNVQIVMEKLGGGGHMNIAGAQVKDKTIEETKALIMETVKEMRESGAI
ncbi:MAG: DHH family phosphoesterase [Lachnospiraceae bacterium]|nr:DHH family phosphoesterase [Lachnospiraceae bacterium]